MFLANEVQRQEYILNQDGIIYQGTENAILAQPWDFSQVSKRSNMPVLSSSHQQKGTYIWCVQDPLLDERVLSISMFSAPFAGEQGPVYELL